MPCPTLLQAATDSAALAGWPARGPGVVFAVAAAASSRIVAAVSFGASCATSWPMTGMSRYWYGRKHSC
jgi:hypothetical protein